MRVGGGLQALQSGPRFGGQVLPAVRPLFDDGVGFLLAVRPNRDQAGKPLGGCLSHVFSGLYEVISGHAEERQSFAGTVEGIGGGFLPAFRRLLHALQRLTGGFRAGHVIRQGDRPGNDSDSDGGPYRGGFPQNGKKAGEATPGRSDGCRERADALGHRADHPCDLAEGQDQRTGRGGDGGHTDNLLTLSGIHAAEFINEAVHALDDPVQRGTEIIAQGLGKEHGLVFEIGQPAGGSAVADVGLVGKRGVLLPCPGGHVLRAGEKIGRVDGAEHGVAQSDLADADLVQGGDRADALVAHLGQPFDEQLKHPDGIALPLLHELLLRDSTDPGKVRQGVSARGGGHLHIDQGFGDRRAAGLRLDADGGQGGGQGQHLRFRQTDLLSGAGDAHGHFSDGRLSGGEVVAQHGDRGTDVGKLALAGAHDVRELGQLRGGGIRVQVRGGIAQIDHDPGELLDVFRRDAQLSAGRHDGVDLIRGGCDLGRHTFGGLRQRLKVCLCSVDGLPYISKRGFEVQTGFDGGGAKPDDGRRNGAGQGFTHLFRRFADFLAAVPELCQGFAGRRPSGLRGTELPVGFAQFRFRLPNGGIGTVQLCLRGGHRVGSVLRGTLQRVVLSGQLFDLRVSLLQFLLKGLHIGFRRDGGGVGLAERVPVFLIVDGGDLHLGAEIRLLRLGVGETLGVILLPGVAFLEFRRSRRQGALILTDRVLLQLQLPLEHFHLRGKPRGGGVEALHPGGRQLEIGLGFPDLFVHGVDVPGEVVRVQRQRYDQVAQGFSHESTSFRLRFQPGPDFVDEAGHGLFFLLPLPGVPGADAEEAEHVHLVDLAHTPSALQQIIVGGIDEVRQRQDSAFGTVGSTSGVVSSAAFVGNSSRISVVCVCTAMRARAMSCISRSTG